MLTRISVIVLIAASVCTAHPSFNHQANVGPHQSAPSLEQERTKPAIQQTKPLQDEVDASDLKTDASNWWRSWNRWGHSWNYPAVSYSYPSVSYASSYPTHYTEKTHYIYTPKTYTYYEPTTYSTYYSVPQTRSHQHWVEPEVTYYQSHGHGHESW